MAKVLLSIPDEELKKIDDYRKKKGLKRNKFFMNAVEVFFQNKKKEEYFYKRKKAVESIKLTSDEIMELGIKDWDPVKELRKARDERAEELLKRWDAD
jgi:metal-responsive CopG/Arc/MetJ family transcriptional regulator